MTRNTLSVLLSPTMPKLVALVSFLAAGAVGTPRSQASSEYTAIVHPDRAEFVFAPEQQAIWEWNQPGSHGADYVWAVTVMQGAVGYELGAYRFTRLGPDPVRGSLADLIAACQHSVAYVANGTANNLGDCEVTVDDRNRVHVVLTNEKLLRKMFARQPATVGMSVTTPKRYGEKQVLVTYEDWQPAPPPPDRPHESAPEALAFLHDKVDQAMYHIEARGAVQARLTCKPELFHRADLTIRAAWTKEPHQVTVDVSSNTFSEVERKDIQTSLQRNEYSVLEEMLLSSSTVARELIVTRSADGDLVKITLWPKDLTQLQPLAHRWYDSLGKLVKQVTLSDGPSGPSEDETKFECEALADAEGRYLVVRRDGSPVEHELRDGFHRITAIWDMDHVSRYQVEIRTAKDAPFPDEWQAPRRPEESSPEALAFLRDKVDQAMYQIEGHGAVQATLTCKPEVPGGDLAISVTWTKEPHQVTVDVRSSTMSEAMRNDIKEQVQRSVWDLLEEMLLSSSTVARELIVTRSTDSDLVKITLWPKDLTQFRPVAHRWYDASGKLVKQFLFGGGPWGPYDRAMPIACEVLDDAGGQYLVVRRDESPVEHELRDGFHRVTAIRDGDQVVRYQVEISTAKEPGR
ncbi:MAG: hypothetical protein U1E76_16840 [Planctomycetota bacterium]